MAKKKVVKKRKSKVKTPLTHLPVKKAPWTCQKCESLNAHDDEDCRYCEDQNGCSCNQPWCMGNCER